MCEQYGRRLHASLPTFQFWRVSTAAETLRSTFAMRLAALVAGRRRDQAPAPEPRAAQAQRAPAACGGNWLAPQADGAFSRSERIWPPPSAASQRSSTSRMTSGSAASSSPGSSIVASRPTPSNGTDTGRTYCASTPRHAEATHVAHGRCGSKWSRSADGGSRRGWPAASGRCDNEARARQGTPHAARTRGSNSGNVACTRGDGRRLQIFPSSWSRKDQGRAFARVT